jgi:cob(I)alamin adenosyltransferase
VGLALEQAHAAGGGLHTFTEQLLRVQCILQVGSAAPNTVLSTQQDIGSCVATPPSAARPAHLARVAFSALHTAELEDWIDEHSATLPPLQAFVLPGGGLTAGQVHVARAVCRRAEREVAPLAAAGDCDPEAARYLNRLSDFLFTVGRVAARAERGETAYTRPGPAE